MDLKIIEEQIYRSKPLVNITDDMVRVTLTLTRNEWREVKKYLKKKGFINEEG